jgi:outer membrane receptor protein involved in Fe transport
VNVARLCLGLGFGLWLALPCHARAEADSATDVPPAANASTSDNGRAQPAQPAAKPDELQLDLGQLNVPGARPPADAAAPAPPPPAWQEQGAVTVISGDELDGAASVADALERVPGADVRRDGGAGQLETLELRGARASQVQVLVDGMPLPNLGVPDLALLPTGGIARAEVLRGSSAGLYGSGALGGAVNIITRGHDGGGWKSADWQTPGPDDADDLTHEDFSLRTGSFGTVETAWSRYGAGQDWHFSTLQAQNDYPFQRVGGGTARRGNNAAELEQLWTAWHYGDWDWRAGAVHLDRGVPGSAEFPTPDADLRQGALWLQAHSATQQAGLSWTGTRFTDPHPYLMNGALRNIDERWHGEWAGGLMAQAVVHAPPPADCIPLGRRCHSAWGWRLRADTASGNAAGGALRTRLGVDATRRWTGEAGGWDWHTDLGVVASSDVGADPVGDVYAAHRLGGGWQAYAAGGYAVRHPDFNDLYYTDTGGVRGNPDLAPERVWQAETGAVYARGARSASAALFYNAYRDSILFLPVSGYLIEARNTGRATVAGAELALHTPLSAHWAWDDSLTWLPLTELAGGAPLAQRAPLHASARLGYSAAPWKLGLAADYASATPADLQGNLRLPRRTLVDIDLSRRYAHGAAGLELRNALDQTARDGWNYPQPGRAVYLTWRMSL